MQTCAAIAESTHRRCRLTPLRGSRYCRQHQLKALRATAITRPQVSEAKPTKMEEAKKYKLPANCHLGDEETIDMSRQKKPYVLMLGSPTCGYCRQTFPEIVEAAKQMRSRDFFVLDTRTSPTLSQQYNVEGVPHIVGVDAKNRVHLFSQTGLPRNAEGLQAFAQSL